MRLFLSIFIEYKILSNQLPLLLQLFYFLHVRLDFLATYAAEHIDGGLIARELQTILGCQVSLAKDLEGKETKANAGNQGTN
jgi:hypothetical protein